MPASARSTASLISALFPLGGVGAIFFGWLMDRFNGNLIIAAGFALTAVAIYAIGRTAGNVGLLMLLVFVGRHPDEHGAVLDAGARRRVLSDAGARDGRGLDAGHRAFRRHRGLVSGGGTDSPPADVRQIFMVVAIPGLISAAALIVKQLAHPEDKSARAVAGGEVLGH